jgi:acetyl-CoA synthetase
MYRASLADPDRFWGDLARKTLTWRRDFTQTRQTNLEAGNLSWFLNGQLNVAENCVDRHAAARPDAVALIWEHDEPGVSTKITYAELQAEVCRLANVLLAHGVGRGDRVCLYLPMTPYAVYAMLACARIGAVHSVVFAGFSAEALRSRIIDARCKVVVTADQGLRGGKPVPLKATVDQAVAGLPFVEHVFVQSRTGAAVPMGPRDVPLQSAMAQARPYCPIVPVDSEDPLFILCVRRV